MNVGATSAYVERWEGRRATVYKDSLGHPTIGVGFNLDRAGAQGRIEDMGLDYDDIRSGAVSLTDDQIDELLSENLGAAADEAERAVANFIDLVDEKQMVIVDMVFNMGIQRFKGFKRAIAAIEAEDWRTAAAELQNSAWYSQVGARAREDTRIMSEVP